MEPIYDLSGRGGRRWLTRILVVSGLGALTAASRSYSAGGPDNHWATSLLHGCPGGRASRC